MFDAQLITGGYPRLALDLIRSGDTPAEFVHESLHDPFSPLVSTARLTLDPSSPTVRWRIRCCRAIGSDDTAHPAFTRSLKTLTEDKELIERELPAWAPPSSRLRRYRDWHDWRGRSVEPLARQALLRLAADDPRLAGVDSVLPWWVRDTSIEVDVVATTRTTTAMVGTIEWRAAGGVTDHDLNRLRADRAAVPQAADAQLAAISPSGQAPRDADASFSAADLLSAWIG